jgi:3-methylcrotonyl-CoA carboxylase beta subunit
LCQLPTNLDRIHSEIRVESSSFVRRSDEYKKLLQTYRQRLDTIIQKSGKGNRQQNTPECRKAPRERIDQLVDPNTPFIELSTFAAFDQYSNAFPSAGIITGIGYIHGRETILVANDASVKGGTYVAETIRKHIRAQEIALQNNLPCVYLVDSGGIFLPEQANVFPDRDDFGRIFYNQARLSSQGIPQISIILGSCTAGGAYIPAMSDETIIVKGQGTIFLGGPPLVLAATGEKVTAEELGGADVHTSQSGVSDHLAQNEKHAFHICRDIFRTLGKPLRQSLDVITPEEPVYPPDELYGVLPINTREMVNSYEIITRLVDRSEMHEFKGNYGKTLITGFAYIMGYPVGIIASNGILYAESALKGTHFIELCNFRKLPIVFLQNITGFMVGKKYENAGIARDGAKLVHAVANANVPKFTLIFGGSYGAGNYAMAGRAFDPNLLFMYPNSKIAVMGGEQAANVISIIKQGQRSIEEVKLDDKEIESFKKPIIDKYEVESSAYFSSSRLWDDGIIDPAETRNVLAVGISASLNKPFAEPKSGIYRM